MLCNMMCERRGDRKKSCFFRHKLQTAVGSVPDGRGTMFHEDSTFIRNVRKADKIVGKTIDVISVVLLLFIFVLGIAQVFWRWVLNDPIVWSEEMIRLTYVWICYLGWVIAERSDSHIRITIISSRLPKSVQKYLQAFCHVLGIIFSVLMVVYGCQLIRAGLKRTAISFPLNYAVVYLIVPVCCLLLAIYEAAQLIECFVKGPRDYSDKGGDEQ